MSNRKSHFHEGAGNPIVGYITPEDGAICRGCGQNEPDFADVDPKEVEPIYFDEVGGGGRWDAYPDGFTCAYCGTNVGSWDYRDSD